MDETNETRSLRKRWVAGAVIAVVVGVVTAASTGFAVSNVSQGSAQSSLDDFDFSNALGERTDAPDHALRSELFRTADLNSLLLMATDGDTEYWSVLREDRLCLVITSKTEQASAGSCAEEKEFESVGVGVRLLIGDSAAEAYLVPDSISSKIGTSIIVVDPFDTRRSAADIAVNDFVLSKLPAVAADEIPGEPFEVAR